MRQSTGSISKPHRNCGRMKTGTKFNQDQKTEKTASHSSQESEAESGRQSTRSAASESGSSQSDALEKQNRTIIAKLTQQATEAREAIERLAAFAAENTEKVGRSALTAEEIDRQFDEGKSIFELGFKAEKATRPGLQRVNLDLPHEFLERLDHAAGERGIARQALIKSWLYDRLVSEESAEIEPRSTLGPDTVAELVAVLESCGLTFSKRRALSKQVDPSKIKRHLSEVTPRVDRK